MAGLIFIIRGLFDLVFEISWQATLLAIVFLIAQKIFARKLRPNWSCAMWGMLILRLAMPALPASPLGIFGNHNQPRMTSAKGLQIVRFGTVSEDNVLSRAATPPLVDRGISSPPIKYPAWRDVLAAIWLLGIAGLLARMTLLNTRFRRRIRAMTMSTDERLIERFNRCIKRLGIRHAPRLIETNLVQTPALYGIWNPVVLIPISLTSKLSDRELDFVLLHELAHLKRRDVLVGWIVWIFNVIHWFNPLLWFAAARFHTDRELACDSFVLASAGDELRHEYGNTILKLLDTLTASKRLGMGSVAMVEDSSFLNRRISAIVEPPMPSRGWLVLFVMLMAGIALPLLTRAQPAVPAPTTSENAVTKVYDCRDLMVNIKSFDKSQAERRFLRPGAGLPEPTTTPARSAEQTMNELIHAIELQVDPDSWIDNGGKIGRINNAAGQLVITQTPENHNSILAMLQSVRQERLSQITVQSRFLGNAGGLMEQTGAAGKWVLEKG